MHSINRRDVIAKAGAVAGASLVALPAVALVAPQASADSAVHRLWHEFRQNKITSHVRVQEYRALYDRLPEWAQVGPTWIKTDPDAFVPPTINLECVSGWPAWDEPIPMLDGLALSRPEPHHVRDMARIMKRHEEWRDEPDAARKFYRVMLRKIREREREKEREWQKLGIFDIDAESNCYSDRQDAIRDEISALETPSDDKVAALVMIGLMYTCDAHTASVPADECMYDTGLAMRVLEALRPMLTGQIAADVADILDYPEKPWGDRLWFLGG